MKRVGFADSIIFLKNPDPNEHFKISSISTFFKLVWKMFLIILLIDLITVVIIVTPLKYFNLFPALKEISFTPINILKITLILPIIEELIFRLPLKITNINIITSISVITFIILNKWCFTKYYFAIAGSCLMFLFLYIGIRKNINFLYRSTTFLKEHFREFFYVQALLFGFLHLANYNLDFKYIYLFPLVVFGYIISGIFWGYLRVRYSSGIYLCIVSHIAVNSLYCLVIFH